MNNAERTTTEVLTVDGAATRFMRGCVVRAVPMARENLQGVLPLRVRAVPGVQPAATLGPRCGSGAFCAALLASFLAPPLCLVALLGCVAAMR